MIERRPRKDHPYLLDGNEELKRELRLRRINNRIKERKNNKKPDPE